MADYKKMYYKLFNAITESIEILKKAQQETEEIYIETDEQDVIKSNIDNKDEK